MSSVLVLGGSGLIGTPVVQHLVAAGHAVTVLNRSGLAAPDVESVLGDRRDPDALARALSGRGFDLVVDILAYDAGDIDRLFAVPRFDLGRYAFISSGQVYLVAALRTPPHAEADADRPAEPEPARDAPDHPEWAYGVGKRAAEAAARAHAAARGIAATALRVPVVHGANDGTLRLWGYLERLLDGGPLLLPDGGAMHIRPIWADDIGRAVAALSLRPEARAPAYNLAQPDEPRLVDFVLAAARALGVTPRLVACSDADLAAAGLGRELAPFSGRWVSRPDPRLAATELDFVGTDSASWLPTVVQAQRAAFVGRSHPSYAQRARELALAEALAATHPEHANRG